MKACLQWTERSVPFFRKDGRTRYPSEVELIFEIRGAEEGGYYARAPGHAIFTQAESWNELRENVLEAVSLHFEDAEERRSRMKLRFKKGD